MLSIFDSNNLIYQGEGTMHIYDKFSSIDTYDYDSFYNIIQSQRTELIRNELKQHYASLSLNDFEKSADIPSNCSILIEKWQFDIFFNFINTKKLYIVLSGSRKIGDPLPLFKRWSWNTAFDGSVLYISDPMFYKFKDCILGWYYGSYEFNIYKYINKIVETINKKYNFQHIIFYGSSGGGFSALQAATYYSNSFAIAINPQIYISRYHYANKFKQHTGIDLNLPDKYNRNKLDTLLKESSSKFFILQNDSDRHDCTEHIFPLLKKYNIKPRYGLQSSGNLYIWIYHAVGGHNSQEDMHILQFILAISNTILENNTLSDTERKFAIALNELWAQIYWLKYTIKNIAK